MIHQFEVSTTGMTKFVHVGEVSFTDDEFKAEQNKIYNSGNMRKYMRFNYYRMAEQLAEEKYLGTNPIVVNPC